MREVVDRGGRHVFELDQKVTWQGAEAVILAQTVEPSCTIEFADGRRLTVGQSTLRAFPAPPKETCNVRGCVFLPHAEVFPHSWEPRE